MDIFPAARNTKDVLYLVPPCRPLNLIVVGGAFALVVQGTIVMVVAPLPIYLGPLVLLTIAVAFRLFQAALEQASPVWIQLTPDALKVGYLLSRKRFAWHDVLEVVTFPVDGRLCDECSDGYDLGLGLYVRSGNGESRGEPDVCIVSMPFMRGRELEDTARRMRAYQRRAMSGLIGADLGDLATSGFGVQGVAANKA